MNFAVNARYAMPNGGKLIIETQSCHLDESRVSTDSVESSQSYVRIAVTDTGCGMPKETLDHIFEPFFTTKEPGKGTGLGLATVYGIVKQSHGHITVHSEPGVGSTFKVFFPSLDKSVRPQRGRLTQPPRGTEPFCWSKTKPLFASLRRNRSRDWDTRCCKPEMDLRP